MPALIHNVRVPVIRKSGAIELLPYGFDEETGITTLGPFEEGTEVDADKDPASTAA